MNVFNISLDDAELIMEALEILGRDNDDNLRAYRMPSFLSEPSESQEELDKSKIRRKNKLENIRLLQAKIIEAKRLEEEQNLISNLKPDEKESVQ